MRRLLPLLLLVPFAGCISSCPSSEDGRAKERIWAPEEPPQAERDATEVLDVQTLATDDRVRRRVLHMEAAEIRHRLGSFQAATETAFTWTRGKRKVALEERAVYEQAASGDFRVAVGNDHDFGMELRWVAETPYMQTRHGKFHERRSDRAGHEAWREESIAHLKLLMALTDGRMQLARVGAGTHHGRPVTRYRLALGDADPAAILPGPPDWTPEAIYPKDGPDEATRHRLAVWQRGEARALTGELKIDDATGVVVALEAKGRFGVPAPEAAEGGPAELVLTITRDISGIGRERSIEVPEHLPFQRRPRAVKDPLDWWPKYVAEKARLEAEAAAASPDAEGAADAHLKN